MTRAELERKLALLMGGRAAEHLVFRHLSTGAADDLSKPTEIARSMATQYAVVPELGHVTYDTQPRSFLGGAAPSGERRYSGHTAHEIDCAVRAIVDHSFDRATQILSENRQVLEDAAVQLLRQETLTEPELLHIFARVRHESVTSNGFHPTDEGPTLAQEIQ